MSPAVTRGRSEGARIENKRTRVNDGGVRISGEVRILLQEIRRAKTGDVTENPTWILGAGDAWLQSAIIPALADLSHQDPANRWEVRNLKAHDICRGLREGEIHFGFIRVEDAARYPGIETSRAFDASADCIMAGNSAAAPKDPVELVRWLLRERRPLVQQGTTWPYTRNRVARALKQTKLFDEMLPQVVCESHTQAAVAAFQSNAWCVVPASLSRLYSGPNIRICKITEKQERNEMTLATYPRCLTKFAGGIRMRDELRKTVGRMLLA